MPNIILGDKLKYVDSYFGEYKKTGTEDEYRKGSVKEITHDGDTIKVSSRGNFSVRFLGIDTPEISFEINGGGSFYHTGSQKWIDYLNDVCDLWNDMKDQLGAGLFNHLSGILDNENVALNHNIHAKRAEDKLEDFITEDMELLELSKENMKFFIPFSYEIMDVYGRLLGFIHPDLKNQAITIDNPPDRIDSYNDRMLKSGYSLPYFIWPNINPFRKESSIVDAVYNSPHELRDKMNNDHLFTQARENVKKARSEQVGVFEPDFSFDNHRTGKLLLEAFELRFLSRQKAPYRFFIDLNADDNVILPPTEYYNYLPEDRLFIPQEYIPLFEKKGWVVS